MRFGRHPATLSLNFPSSFPRRFSDVKFPRPTNESSGKLIRPLPSRYRVFSCPRLDKYRSEFLSSPLLPSDSVRRALTPVKLPLSSRAILLLSRLRSTNDGSCAKVLSGSLLSRLCDRSSVPSLLRSLNVFELT